MQKGKLNLRKREVRFDTSKLKKKTIVVIKETGTFQGDKSGPVRVGSQLTGDEGCKEDPTTRVVLTHSSLGRLGTSNGTSGERRGPLRGRTPSDVLNPPDHLFTFTSRGTSLSSPFWKK